MDKGSQGIRRRLLGAFSAVLFAVGALGALPVSAETSLYHGTVCKPFYETQADSFTNQAYGLVNGNYNRWVACTIDRQDTSAVSTNSTSIQVRMYNGGGSTFCYAYTMSSTGSILDSDSRSTTAGGNQTMYLNVNQSNGSYYHVQCYIRPYSTMRGIYVYEP